MIDPPQDGPWNMAVDETLLETAAEQGVATLRFYGWSEPTLSLGYFQSSAERAQHPASRDCAVVRRSSGGGAILHDREVTYSLTLPAGHPLSANTDRLYDAVHCALVAVLNDFLGHPSGQIAQICTPNASPAVMPFLCFQRRTPGDVVLSDTRNSGVAWKIAGSAQRRRRGAVLQHGSVLLATSPSAPELPGIAELTHRKVVPEEFEGAWTDRLCSAVDIATKPDCLRSAEKTSIGALVAERFASSAWTNRR